MVQSCQDRIETPSIFLCPPYDFWNGRANKGSCPTIRTQLSQFREAWRFLSSCAAEVACSLSRPPSVHLPCFIKPSIDGLTSQNLLPFHPDAIVVPTSVIDIWIDDIFPIDPKFKVTFVLWCGCVSCMGSNPGILLLASRIRNPIELDGLRTDRVITKSARALSQRHLRPRVPLNLPPSPNLTSLIRQCVPFSHSSNFHDSLNRTETSDRASSRQYLF